MRVRVSTFTETHFKRGILKILTYREIFYTQSLQFRDAQVYYSRQVIYLYQQA